MQTITTETTFCDYYRSWIEMFKKDAVRNVTLKKYQNTLTWLEKLIPETKLSDMNRMTYQLLINNYAKEHEKQTTMDFHHQVKSAILDAVDEGLIERDPTRKVVIKGKPPRKKKIKFLSQYELHALLADLNLGQKVSYDWLIYLIAKTGMRFSEAIAVTPADFDFVNQTVVVNKTLDYKAGGGFVPTKNESSKRRIQIDWQTAMKFSGLIQNYPKNKPVFSEIGERIFNSTINDILARHCRKLGISIISAHGLRHTHASLLLYAGVSTASVSKRLGHASIATTQKIYLHVIQELENQDINLVMRSLSSLN